MYIINRLLTNEVNIRSKIILQKLSFVRKVKKFYQLPRYSSIYTILSQMNLNHILMPYFFNAVTYMGSVRHVSGFP
jgi:hypothetical protein